MDGHSITSEAAHGADLVAAIHKLAHDVIRLGKCKSFCPSDRTEALGRLFIPLVKAGAWDALDRFDFVQWCLHHLDGPGPAGGVGMEVVAHLAKSTAIDFRDEHAESIAAALRSDAAALEQRAVENRMHGSLPIGAPLDMGGDDAVPEPGSPAASSRAAHDLYVSLQTVLTWFDLLRAVDLGPEPKPVPKWWDGYVQSVEWSEMAGPQRSPNRADRLQFARRRTQTVLKYLLREWDAMTVPIPKSASDQIHFEACRASLRNLFGILSPAQLSSHLLYGVIPDERHLSRPLPLPWDGPESESEEERTTREAMERAQSKATRNRLSKKLTGLTAGRDARNEKAAMAANEQGLATRAELEHLKVLRRDWADQLVRWTLGEADVRKLVQVLGSHSKESPQPVPSAMAVTPRDNVNFSPDFRSCVFGARGLHFTRSQAACLRAIWMLSDEGKHSVAQSAVFDKIAAEEWAKIKTPRLDQVFRHGKSGGVTKYHAGWGTLVVKDPSRNGFYQIGRPAK